MLKFVPQNEIIESAYSRNTIEDAELSKPIVDKCNVKDIIVVSSDFHMERVKFIFSNLFGDYKLKFSTAHTNPKEITQKMIEHEKKELQRLRKCRTEMRE